MSTYFSRVIKAGGKQREFNFRQLSNEEGIKYSVDVPDDKGLRITFQMITNNEGQWKTIAKPLQPWINEAETDLSNAIKENF
jgi:hypothetical protein